MILAISENVNNKTHKSSMNKHNIYPLRPGYASKVNPILEYYQKINSISNYGKMSASWAIKMPEDKKGKPRFKKCKIEH